MPVYNFEDQKKLGDQGEEYLDNFFEDLGFIVRCHDSTLNDSYTQKRGIDRTLEKGDSSWDVEYKTDIMATRTGNAFLEIISRAEHKKVGWVLSSQAHSIAYYVPATRVYLFKPDALRAQLPLLVGQLRWRTVTNEDYHAFGMLLPLKDLEGIAYQTWEI